MQVRGEANSAVSINEASLEAVLISGCMGAVLFTMVPSLTPLIPNGLGKTRHHSGAVLYKESQQQQKKGLSVIYIL